MWFRTNYERLIKKDTMCMTAPAILFKQRIHTCKCLHKTQSFQKVSNVQINVNRLIVPFLMVLLLTRNGGTTLILCFIVQSSYRGNKIVKNVHLSCFSFLLSGGSSKANVNSD